MITAVTTKENIYRGSEEVVPFKAHNPDGSVYEFEGDEEVLLHLVFSWTEEGEPAWILLKEGILTDLEEGEGYFAFSASDTAKLTASAYDITVTINGYVVLQDRLGILGRAPQEG